MSLSLPALILPLISTYLLLVLLLPTRFYVLNLKNPHLSAQLVCLSLIFLSGAVHLYPTFENYTAPPTSCNLLTTVFNTIFMEPISSLKDFIQAIFSRVGNTENKKLIGEASLLFSISLYTSILSFIIELLFRKSPLRAHFERTLLSGIAGRISFQLSRLMYDKKPALLTMKNNKVYVGYIIYIPSLRAQKKDFTLLPLFSGYRDNEQHLILTNNYKTLWDVARKIHTDPEIDSIAINDTKDEEIVKISKKRIIEMTKGTTLTLNCDEIFSVGEWFPELYDMQSISSNKLSSVSKNIPAE